MNNKVKYGLIGGAVFFLWLLLEYYAGFYKGPYDSIFRFMPFYMVLIYFSINTRKKEMEGQMRLSDGFKAGLGSAALASVISAAFTFIYYNWINLGAKAHFAVEYQQNLIKAKKTPDEIQTMLKDFNDNFPAQASFMTVTMMLFAGLLIALIISAVLQMGKKQEA